jgi:L-cysteine/cystine lyase
VGSSVDRLALIQERSSQLWHGLQAIPGITPLLTEPPPAGLVSFNLAGVPPDQAVVALGKQAIWLRSLEDPACLRACTHVTSTAEEVDRLLAALAGLVKRV